MPLNADEFAKKSVERRTLKLGRNQLRIIAFFKTHMDKAYTQREIAEVLNIKYDAAVNTALHSLKIKHLVICKMNMGIMYWRGTNAILEVGTYGGEEAARKATDDEDRDGEVSE